MGQLISVFTPSHDPTYLDEAYESLRAQTEKRWEWVVLLNGGAEWSPPPDKRVVVRIATEPVSGVGEAKRMACEACTGDLLVELDHDDLLAPSALAHVRRAFTRNSAAVLVYSDFAQITGDGEPDPSMFNLGNGWSYRTEEVMRREVLVTEAMEATPHNVSLIWFAPNHLRAFRAEAYRQAGGYDAQLGVLDDQDLMGRLYQLGSFVRIPHCLYLQRMHGGNTQTDAETNARIQVETVEMYERDLQASLLAWCAREGLKAIDMGAAHRKAPGFLGLDQYEGDGVDVVADVTEGLPFPDDSVGAIRAVDFLEHVPDKIALWNEMYRVLAPGGMLLSLTPSTDGRGAFQDPTHVAFYNENSFWYWTDRSYAEFVPQIECRFQVSRLRSFYPSGWHEERSIAYVQANLIAIKDGGARQGGPLNI